MIPSAVKDGKLYSIRPTDGSGDFTFSRGSNLAATRVDVNGLIEKGRENLALQGSDISTQSGSWFGNQGGVTTQNAATSPIGTNTASQITANGFSTYSGVKNAGIVMGALRYTYSVYLKAQSGTPDIRLTCYDGVTFHQQDFSITTEWERYSITFTPTAGTNSIYITSQQAVSWYAWGAQFEQGLVATDYIETTTTTAVSGITEDLPRLDYSGGASCPSLLLEPQRTNLVTQSEYFGSGDWNKLNASVTDNNATSPEGIQNASLLTISAALGSIYDTVGGSGNFTFSVFAKYVDMQYMRLRSTGSYVYFDIQNGSVETELNGTGSIEDYGNGWYRCSVIGNNTNSLAQIFLSDTEGGTVTGTGSALIYGAQFEEGSYPSSYIPTYGSAVTRSQDVCVNSSLTTSTNFTIFFEAPDFCLINGTTGVAFNNVQFAFSSNGSAYPTDGSYHIYDNSLYYWNGSSNTSFGVIYNNQTDSKFALMKRGDSMIVFANGVKVNEVTLPSGSDALVSNWDAISLTVGGLTDAQGDVFKPNYKQLLKFDTALTDSECIALTTL